MAHRILFTIPNFVTAGSGRALFEVVRRLDRNRFEPTVCVSSGGGPLMDEFAAEGIPVLVAPFTVAAKPYVGLPLRIWNASKTFRNLDAPFDLWHSYHYLDDYTEPLIARAAGARAWVYAKKNMGWNGRAWHLRTRFASAVLAQNQDMMNDFFSRPASFRRKARLVPRGVNLQRFTVVSQAVSRGESQGRKEAHELRIGCVAQMVKVKGHPTLLDAVARCPGTRLLLAGKALDEEYVDALKTQIRELGIEDRVEWMGHVQDVPTFLRSLDVFVLSTWAKWRMEGCPVALLEAMATGLPVIATAIPGSKDVVVDGECGLLVPPEDVGALAEAVERMRDPELRRRLGQAARRRMEDHYSIEREVADHETVYEALLGS